MKHFDVGSGSVGLQKYLQRQMFARQQKDELECKKAKVFRTGANWTPKPTKPVQPKMSANIIKGDRTAQTTVKALRKAVNPIQSHAVPKKNISK